MSKIWPDIITLKGIPELPDYAKEKRKRPKMVALVDEDNCTGCQACVPFCQ